MLSRRLAVVVTIVIVVSFVVVAVAPAFAATPASLVLHARLLGSTPRDGQTVASAEQVVLAFNEDVDPTFVEVTVTGSDGAQAAGEPSVRGREVTQALSADLPAGEHLVTYRVVSTDGHPVSGTVTFTTTTAPTGSSQPSASASATAGATASAAPSPAAPATDPATVPVADDSSGPWPLLLGAIAVLALLAGLLAARARRPRGPHEGAPDGTATPPASGTDPRPVGDHDPFA